MAVLRRVLGPAMAGDGDGDGDGGRERLRLSTMRTGGSGAFVELCLVLRSAAAIAARRRQSSAAWCRGFVGNGHGKTAVRVSTTLTQDEHGTTAWLDERDVTEW